ncbi:MAG TPA: hypothetical protein VIR60_07640 [Gammaproteobacteria bacterium]
MRVLAACCGLFVCAAAAAADIVVIVADAAPEEVLDEGTLRDIYLKKIFLDAAGRRRIPVNLPADAPLREAFSRALFHKSTDELQDYWNQNYFHGITPPYVLGSQDAMVRFVARTPGAIGYIASCYLRPGVRQVLTLPLGADTGVDMQALCPQGNSDRTKAAE